MSTRVIRHKKYRIEVDTASQQLALEMGEPRSWVSGGEPPLVARPSDVPRARGFVSASMLALKCKQVDDRIYAAVERAAQGGSAGKRALLDALGQRLAAANAGAAAPIALLAAATLGGCTLALEPPLARRVQREIDRFLADPLRSKPIGFYGESDDLAAIFRQDRMLQADLSGEDTGTIARALHADPALRAIYERSLALVEKLTNPFACDDLRPFLAALDRGAALPGLCCAFFPPSIAHETELMKKLFGDRPVPEGFDLADEMIDRIQRRVLSLRPGPAAGWYDHQTWATEPLLLPERTPEAAHLRLDDRYRARLRALWKAIMAFQRETHIKQLEIPLSGSGARGPERPTVYIAPELTVEPTCEHYRRRVLAYRFVRGVVSEAFGPAAVSPAIVEELDAVEALCTGAYATACLQIGLTPDPAIASDAEAAAADFAQRGAAGGDPDFDRDARLMVPVFHDPRRELTKVWAVLGWTAEPLSVSFTKRPKVRVFDDSGRPATGALDVVFTSESRELIYPVTAELYVSRVLDRAEFRKHCDTHRTRSAILANLH